MLSDKWREQTDHKNKPHSYLTMIPSESGINTVPLALPVIYHWLYQIDDW